VDNRWSIAGGEVESEEAVMEVWRRKEGEGSPCGVRKEEGLRGRGSRDTPIDPCKYFLDNGKESGFSLRRSYNLVITTF
jgi:hypothetical protein